jgi:hypothetical protein
MLIDVFNVFGWSSTDKSFKPTKTFSNKWWDKGEESAIYGNNIPTQFSKEELEEKFKLANSKGMITLCWKKECVTKGFQSYSRKYSYRVKCNNKIENHYLEHSGINNWIERNITGNN